jgi:hypothetical protein
MNNLILKKAEKSSKSRKDRKKAEKSLKSRIFLLKAEEVAALDPWLKKTQLPASLVKTRCADYEYHNENS